MRILSGIQPSGKLHVGNYFGMMQPAIQMQDQAEIFLFIADYHALTTTQDAKILKKLTNDAVLDFLACGIDPKKTFFYKQSDVPEVHELAWLLSTVTPMGLLERCHSYKDKMSKGIPSSHALFSYPVLMASDILSINADIIPVGKDQKQHVEVTRDLAERFNNLFGEVFVIPKPSIKESVSVVPGIDGQKMSKSYKNTIDIFDSGNSLKKRIMKIITDSKDLHEPKNPKSCNIFSIYKLFANETEQKELAELYYAGGMGYGHAKTILYETIERYFAPMREKKLELVNNKDLVDDILSDGAKKASNISSDVLCRARLAVGLE
tara:strand:- start:317 stop:1279 length:963 start_codon:yes stop_codon:yes gene_type:complete